MSVDALIEEQTLLYKKVKESVEQHIGKLPAVSQVDVIFTSVHNWQMNAAIDKQQSARFGQKEAKPKTDTPCVNCGSMLTEGEKKYCDDADKKYRCYKCSKK